MAIPSFRVFLRPVLEAMANVGELNQPRSSLVPIVKEQMKFSDEEAAEKLESGGNRLQNRIGWALTYLKKAGLITFPKRSYAMITAEGRKFLTSHTGEISPKDLEVYPGFVQFKSSEIKNDDLAVSSNDFLDEIDPEEKINIGFSQIKITLIEDIKEKLLELTPRKFEIVVLDLIRGLGYGGANEKLEHTGQSGDFGIDGIVHLDRLGLDKIYLQAKRYKPENKISSRQIQEFFGALKGRGASKGIYLTTSTYQDSAIEYAKKVSDTLVLLDGNKIAELMIDSEVGVSAKRKIVIPEIDNDYFDS
jgi:restriction system protein